MSTAAHSKTDGQTGQVSRDLEDAFRSYATSFTIWGAFLPLDEFTLNNAVQAQEGCRHFL